MEFDEDYDARGLICPLPVLKAVKLLRAMAPGSVLRLQADDPLAAIDIPNMCREAGHEVLSFEQDGGVQTYLIRKG